MPVMLAAALAVLVGCNFRPPSTSNPGTSVTPTPDEIARATVLGDGTPASSTATVEPSATRASAPTSASASASGSPVGMTPGACTDEASFVDDVTFRDNTLILPGTAFVKIWRLQNTGTCTWDTGYAVGFIGGARMEAPSPVHLTTTVPPRSSVDLAVDMIAPQEPGTYQGFWKLIDRNGGYFGIGSDADVAFWVKVIVPSLPTETGVVAPTLTPTASATPRPTPEVIASGFASLAAEMNLDLDTGELNPPAGADVSFLGATPGPPAVAPTEGAQLSRYGPPPDPPSPARCQALNLSTTAIPLSSLSVQGLVCYRTGEGRLGYFRVKSLDDVLGLDFVTWGP